MSLPYISEYYSVPAEVNGRVEFEDKPGTIVGDQDAYILVRLDGETDVLPYHPTWHMKYLAAEVSAS